MLASHQPSKLPGVTEGVFCPVTLRGCCREIGLKKGVLGSVVMLVLVSSLETVTVVTSCVKGEIGR